METETYAKFLANEIKAKTTAITDRANATMPPQDKLLLQPSTQGSLTPSPRFFTPGFEAGGGKGLTHTFFVVFHTRL